MSIQFMIPHYIVINQNNVITALTIMVLFLLVLLVFGIYKTVKLKAEHKKLNKKSVKKEEVYQDFTEGHLY